MPAIGYYCYAITGFDYVIDVIAVIATATSLIDKAIFITSRLPDYVDYWLTPHATYAGTCRWLFTYAIAITTPTILHSC